MIKRCLVGSLLASTAFVSLARAQDGVNSGVIALEELVVQAQRREQLAKDVPISLRSFPKEELDARLVKRIDEAFESTPNAIVTSQRGGNDASIVTIRGVANTAFGSAPNVAIYVDDVYIGNDNGFNSRMGDLSQIEILRGPQGTLYGRNAIGGAVNIRTGKPELGVNSFNVRSGVGSDGLYFGQATANFALSEQIAARVTLFGDGSRGSVNNQAGGPNFLNADTQGGRAKVLFAPSADLNIEVSVDYSRDNGRNQAYGPFFTVFKNGVNLGRPFLDDSENFGTSLKVTSQTGFGEVVSVTAYRKAEGKGRGGAYEPDPMQSAAFERSYDQFTQEIRAQGKIGRIDWTLGAFGLYSKERRYEAAGFFPSIPANAFFLGQPTLPANYEEGTRTNSTTLNLALFGDATWHVTDRLDLIAGLRGSYDRNRINYNHGSTLGAFAFLAPPLTTRQSVGEFDASPRVGLQYKLTDDMNVYGTISRGYKPSGFNIAFAPNTNIKYDSESAINYEIGLKGSSLDGRLNYSLSAFYFDWRDQQVYSFNNNVLTISNAPKSRTYGAEGEVSLKLVEGLTLTAGVGFLNAKFIDYPNAQSGLDESGNWQPFSSRFSANLSAEYRRPIFAGIEGVARVDFNYRSSFFWNTANTIKEPAYGLVNARIGVESKNWSVSAFAQNLFDHEYRIRAETYAQGVLAVPGRPRTLGVVATATF